MKLLDLQNLNKTYHQGASWGRKKKVQALSDISLNLRNGECLAIVGSSGSGKSTLGRLILGLERPDSGEILFKGCNVKKFSSVESSYARRNRQVVFQNSIGAVNPRFKVRQIIAEPLLNFENFSKEEMDLKVLSLLQKVALGADLAEKLPQQCSGGELQRVCIARAMALEPELIVLDEALSALDMLNQAKILKLLGKIKKDTGTGFIFITHDLRLVSKIADSMGVLKKGRLEFYLSDMKDPQQLEELRKNPVCQALRQAILPPLPEL